MLVFIVAPESAATAQQRVSVFVLLYSSNASKLSAPVDAREKVWPVAALLQLCIALLQLCCSSVAASKLSAPVYAREEVWPRAKRVNEVLAPQLPHLQKKRHVKKKSA